MILAVLPRWLFLTQHNHLNHLMITRPHHLTKHNTTQKDNVCIYFKKSRCKTYTRIQYLKVFWADYIFLDFIQCSSFERVFFCHFHASHFWNCLLFCESIFPEETCKASFIYLFKKMFSARWASTVIFLKTRSALYSCHDIHSQICCESQIQKDPCFLTTKGQTWLPSWLFFFPLNYLLILKVHILLLLTYH